MSDFKVRSFLIAYSYPNGIGNYWPIYFGYPAFPENTKMKELLAPKAKCTPSEVVITNIVEFKSIEDYACFSGRPMDEINSEIQGMKDKMESDND